MTDVEGLVMAVTAAHFGHDLTNADVYAIAEKMEIVKRSQQIIKQLSQQPLPPKE